MAKLFMSHSSLDKPFVGRVATDLENYGHECWIDKTSIIVGDSISEEIQKGIAECDYLLVFLSKSAVESKWLKNEWLARYYKQVTDNKVSILPCLIETCEIPTLLEGRKFANFVMKYEDGLGELLARLNPAVLSAPKPLPIDQSLHSELITALLTKAHDDAVPLSVSMAEGIALARKLNNPSLEEFCRNELQGYDVPDQRASAPESVIAPWRMVQCYASAVGQINTYSFVATTEATLFDFIKRHPDKFIPNYLVWNQSLSEIEHSAKERKPESTAMVLSRKYGTLYPGRGHDDVDVPMYMRSNVHRDVIEAIRRKFVAKLLECLPKIESA